ncbi:hypothetical protein OA50_05277 [Mameliella alba]|uniref:Methyltransferase n=1 Tax=Mameliella alba TaxID=561184 RepID=A0A0B3RTQ7_9RHOB|nr:hypothetical protein OA50_05277 [Mameliella alba]
MTDMKDASGYRYHGARNSPAHGYLLPALTSALEALRGSGKQPRLFDLGCGNGSIAANLAGRG